MSKFKIGDKVRFRGDPGQEVFKVYYVYYFDDNYVDVEDAMGGEIEGVPTRLLELVPVYVKPGQVWKHRDTGDRVFVVDVVNDVVALATVGSTTMVPVTPKTSVPEHYELEHDV